MAKNKKTQTAPGSCPVCGFCEHNVFIEILSMPVYCNVLWPTRRQALRAPKGDIHLSHCKTCGHVYNIAFNPDRVDYGLEYENSLHFSPRFQKYAQSLARHLIDKYELRGKTIIEIACGKGDFLRLLCQLGQNRGIGFDPSYHSNDGQSQHADDITFVQDYFSQDYAHHNADLICCRHALEHIPAPREFMRALRQAINGGRKPVLFFEVPNVMFTMKHLGIWDIIYEHCSYFTRGSLARLFRSTGFDVKALQEQFEAQFLCIEAFPGKTEFTLVGHPSDDDEDLPACIDAFATRYYSKLGHWRHHLQDMNQAGKKAVVWGGGSKGVTFLNMFKDLDIIKYLIDINPRKHGMYVPCTGHQILSPDFLSEYRPDAVIVMNPIYRSEIEQVLKEKDLTTDVMVA